MSNKETEKVTPKMLKQKLIRSLISMLIPVVIAIVTFSAQTVAYFSDTVSAGDNLLQSGELSISVNEYTVAEGTGELVPFPDGPMAVMPGTEISKVVTVKNSGDLSLFLRVSLDTVFNMQVGQTSDASHISFAVNEEHWVYRDGFYYYKEALTSGRTTEPIFEKVSFSPKMGNEYRNSTVEIRINAYATQVTDNGIDPLGASGWPSPVTSEDGD